ncbi:hypothetical protein Golax_021939 [Gossypium laxum]|uniref:Uncharacterized protein n=2 Tax=Gossypium TaxID=3633 RepID=A0A7J8YAP2_GOSAI|nr:hypothetical protein [Gossypium aridum]MBA0725344.1 hypothetical protein [Gossypium laxum]
MVADIDTFDSILCCIVFILSYILQNGDDSVDRKLENETMAAFVSYFSSSPALICIANKLKSISFSSWLFRADKYYSFLGCILSFALKLICLLWTIVQTLLQQIVSSYFELFWYSIRNFRTINFKQI